MSMYALRRVKPESTMKIAYLGLVSLIALSCNGRNEEVKQADLTPSSVPSREPPTATPPQLPAPGAPTPSPATTPNSQTTSTAPPSDFRHQFVLAAKAIGPAVVAITSTSVARPTGRGSASPFDFFFRGDRGQSGRGEVRQGIGSGVIIDTQGNVLTNNHVVEGADEVKVVLAGNQEIMAKLVGTDPKSDLAVVKIDPGKVKLTAAVLGDSDKLEVGEWVIACGSPFGLRQTVSAGIVSAIGRGNVGITEYEDFIQTDAAINPGNSGGPLVDLEGRVVGVNTAIASQSGGNNGVGFAIPISMAKFVLEQLVKTGKVVRGYAGLLIGDVNADLAESFNYKGEGGALVQDVSQAGPGARAGLKPGDIIIARDGRPVLNAGAFRNGIADSNPGKEVKLEVWRDGNRIEVPLTLGELPVGDQVAAKRGSSSGSPDIAKEPARWGVGLSDITPEIAQRLQLGATRGALVQQVQNGSPADEAGLTPGDVIVAIGDREVKKANDAKEILQKSEGPVRLRVVREGRGFFVVLPRA
jgi:serine protease Do